MKQEDSSQQVKSVARLFESVRIGDKVDCNRVSIDDNNEELDYLRKKVRILEDNIQGIVGSMREMGEVGE